MRYKSFLLLGILGLFAYSSTSYGALKKSNYRGSCLEKICEYGCVEDETSGEGHCCSKGAFGDSCDAETGGCACQSTLSCGSNKKCSCPSTTPIWDSTQKKCVECLKVTDCAGGLTCNPNKTCGCPKETPIWDNSQKKCVECLTNNECGTGLTCRGGACVSPSSNCLGPISACGKDALGFEYNGHTYCYNTHEEFVKRCREAVPHTTSCHNGRCFYASNSFNEDFKGNCHWGYFDFNDAQNWCKSKGGRTVTKSEMQALWDEFIKCDPSFGKHNESCYWTNTRACRTKDGGWNNARVDGYINAGGGFCQIK